AALRAEPEPLEARVERGGAAVDDHEARPVLARRGHLGRERAQRARVLEALPRDLDDHVDGRGQRRPSPSSSRNMRFAFWTAWPAAPFTRLSMADTITARRVAASNASATSQKFVPSTAATLGNSPAGSSRTNGRPA